MPLTNAQKERVIEDSLRGGAAAKHAWPNQIMLEDIRAEVRHINVPTLVLSGEHDQVHPAVGVREEVLSFISGAQLQVLPGTGHLPMLEAPELVAQSIRRFASELQADACIDPAPNVGSPEAESLPTGTCTQPDLALAASRPPFSWPLRPDGAGDGRDVTCGAG